MNTVKRETRTWNTKKIKIGSECNTKIHIFPYCAIKAEQRQSNYVHLIPMNGIRFREIQLQKLNACKDSNCLPLFLRPKKFVCGHYILYHPSLVLQFIVNG